MSNYTTQVRTICESFAGLRKSEGANSVDNIIEASKNKVFNFDFPIFDEEYRGVLEHKILKHYYTREIGLETVGLWQLKLNTMLNEIMPYYNQLYKTTSYEFNPLRTKDYTRELKKDSTAQQETTLNSTTSGNTEQRMNDESLTFNKFSDTPQGSLQGLINNEYLTNATQVDSTDTTTNNTETTGSREDTSNGSISSTDQYLERYYGYDTANPSDLILKYRKTLLNIDLMIIEKLEPLFFQLW